MRTHLTNVRAYCIRPLFTATLGLALALTFSCSSDDGGGSNPVSDFPLAPSSSSARLSSSSSAAPSSYCIYQGMQQCFLTSQAICPVGGELSDFCPFVAASSSSSSSRQVEQSSSSALPEYGYCVFDTYRICLSGVLTTCPTGGTLSNDCPYSSSSETPSSSSAVVSSSSSNPSSSSSLPPSSSSAVASSSSSNPSSSSSLPPSSSSIAILSGTTFTDSRDSKSYKWVKIGTQTWMGENLNYNASGSKCYGEGGQTYVNVEGYEGYSTLSNAEVQANCTKYGRLYNWATAMANSASSAANPSGVRGVCPTGWHIPSNAEWEMLGNFAGGSNATKLKATSGWNDYYGQSGNGTDSFGFSALPGGYGISDGSFDYAGYYGLWWSATENYGYNAYIRSMIYDNELARWYFNFKSDLFSVRCLQD